jgi:hypothetical protein
VPFGITASHLLFFNQSLHIPRYRQMTGPIDQRCNRCLRKISGTVRLP